MGKHPTVSNDKIIDWDKAHSTFCGIGAGREFITDDGKIKIRIMLSIGFYVFYFRRESAKIN